MHQLCFADIEISTSRKPRRIAIKLDELNKIINWADILDVIKVVDRTDKKTGGALHKYLLVKLKMLFLQHIYYLSDPELEDQVNDRLSFQNFIAIDFRTTVPDYRTIWRFRERLIEEGINDKLFDVNQRVLIQHYKQFNFG